MDRRKGTIWVAGGAVLFVVGLPGLFEDLATWKEWLAVLSLSGWLSLCSVILGIGLIVFGLLSRTRSHPTAPYANLSEQAVLKALEIERAKHSETLNIFGNIAFGAIIFGFFLSLVALESCTQSPPDESAAASARSESEPSPGIEDLSGRDPEEP